MEKQRRLQWIDMLKGVGILSIIYTHVTGDHSPFIYAVPLFFILSGYMHSSISNTLVYVKKLFVRLMIPYIAFSILLIILNIPETDKSLENFILDNIIASCIGGRVLIKDFGVFWFINTFFLSSILYHYIKEKKIIKYFFPISFVLTLYFHKFPTFLPWSLDACPIALLYMFIGGFIKNHVSPQEIDIFTNNKKYTALLSFLIVVVLCNIPNIYLDIKIDKYGIPVLSIILSVIACSALAVSLNTIEKSPYFSIVNKALSFIGKGSLFIMFVHQFFNNHIVLCDNKYIHYVIVVLFSSLLFAISNSNSITRTIFCGTK